MIGALISEVLLRELPPHLRSGVSTGEMKVFGSIIRSVTTGRIAGHLQETTALTRLAGGGLLAPINLTVDIAGHAATIVQNEQIKAAVALVQQLQLGSLLLGVSGIGVSIAGAAILAQKVNRVEKKIEALGEQFERAVRGIESLRRERIALDMDRLRTLGAQLEEGWILLDAAEQWRAVARDAHGLVHTFERRTAEALSLATTSPFEIEPLQEAVALAGAIRIAARLAAGDDTAARQASAEIVGTLSKLGEGIRMGDAALTLTQSRRLEFGSPSWAEGLEKAQDDLRHTIGAIRQREAAAASTAITLNEIGRQGIRGRAWLEAARDEQEAPLLCLLPR